MPDNGNGYIPEVNREIAEQRERLNAVIQGQNRLSADVGNFIAKTDERFGTLAKDLDTKFSSLTGAISDRSKTPWGNIIAACGVTFGILSGLIALITGPIISNVGETKVAMRETRLEMAVLVKDAASVLAKDTDVLRARVNEELRLLRENQVPRKEHEKDWSSQARADADMQRQINEIRSAHSSLYSAQDVIRRLENQVDQLRDEVRRRGNG